ncbi:MAG TPA: ATP-binding cassette domain-containing protein [Azospirillum sp.]
MAILSIRDVTKTFGGIAAVDHVSFDLSEGELVGLIGPNGSGKTTLINMLSGLLPVGGGDILLDGASLLGLSADRIAQRGVLRMFQLTRAFNRISALDNLLVAGRALGLDAEAAKRRALTLLEELRIDHVMNLDAGQLSGGQRKLLEFGTCFMVPPRVALLDEPFAAVHPTMRAIMADFVRRRHGEGQTFVLVSHDMPIVRELCPRAVCMNAGAVIADAPTRAVLDDPHVIEAYLGGHAA